MMNELNCGIYKIRNILNNDCYIRHIVSDEAKKKMSESAQRRWARARYE